MLLRFENKKLIPCKDTMSVYKIAHDEDLSKQDITSITQDVIALDFPIYRDGRAFTQARHLREAGFTGDIRATGDVRRDQALYMVRCGFTQFELAQGETAEGFAEAMEEFSAFYQPAMDQTAPAWRRRHRNLMDAVA